MTNVVYIANYDGVTDKTKKKCIKRTLLLANMKNNLLIIKFINLAFFKRAVTKKFQDFIPE